MSGKEDIWQVSRPSGVMEEGTGHENRKKIEINLSTGSKEGLYEGSNF